MTAKRTQFVSSRSGSTWTRGQNMTAFTSRRQYGPIFSVIAIFSLIAIFAVVYLFQVTKTNSFSYALQEVENQKAILSAEREDLRNENARLQSAQNVNSTSTAQSMTSPTSIEYAE